MEISILEIDDSLKRLMESVLNNFTEDVSNSFLNLLVNTVLNINLGVVNLSHALVTGLLEYHAIALLVHVEHVMRADTAGITGANWMHSFFRRVASVTFSFIEEASCLTDGLFLNIKFVAAEVTSDLEDFSLILPASSC
jgi:hypothetical protein